MLAGCCLRTEILDDIVVNTASGSKMTVKLLYSCCCLPRFTRLDYISGKFLFAVYGMVLFYGFVILPYAYIIFRSFVLGSL